MSSYNNKQKKPVSLRERLTSNSYKAAPYSNKRSSLTNALMVAAGVSSLGTHSVSAQTTPAASEKKGSNAIELIEVYGQPLAPYKAIRSGDLRRGAALADLPQTLSILTQTQIEDSGKTDLKDILSSQSGITLGTGENGNAFGDRYIIRGHEARSDVFVDGIRDPGMTTRESFANEQVEITKGPSATFAGRGSSGGAVNSITKQANNDKNFSILKNQLGSDDHHRITLDTNTVINDRVALRANILHAQEQVPDRKNIENERIGALLSASVVASDKISLTLDYYNLQAKDDADLGSYFDQGTRSPVSNIPVYAQKDDFLDTDVESLTFKFDYTLSDSLRFQNSARIGKTDNGYITTGIRGTNRATTDPQAPGAATAVLSTHQGWQEVEYAVNQSNLFLDLNLGDIEHKFVFGVEYSDETVVNGVFNIQNNADSNCLVLGRRGVSNGYCAIDASGNYDNNINTLLSRSFERGNQDADQTVTTVSAYVMDSVTLSENWSGFLGVRLDSFDYENTVMTRSGDELNYNYSDSLWNGHVGIVRNIKENGNIYATYSTATNINGGESDVGSSCGYGGLCGSSEQVSLSDPERVRNIELGTKWQLFDQRLLATAALFSITKDDVMESVGDDYSTLGTLNTGKNRVEGIEFSLTGAITNKLSAQFNATFMDSEILDAYNPEQISLALSNFADNQAYLQLRYDASGTFSFGGSVTHKSKMFGGQPDSAAGLNSATGEYFVVVPSYNVLDLFINYYPSDTLNFKLNIGNVTDEEYFTAAYRSGSFMYLGNAQNIRASMTYNF